MTPTPTARPALRLCRPRGAAPDVADLLGLDVHAGDKHDVRPGKVRRGRECDILVDEADRPILRHVGRDQEETLRRHERLYPVHQLVGVLKAFRRPASILETHTGCCADSGNGKWQRMRHSALAIRVSWYKVGVTFNSSGKWLAGPPVPNAISRTDTRRICPSVIKSLYAAQQKGAFARHLSDLPEHQ